MKVCYFGTYRPNYSRNQIMIDGLRAVGVEVIECHAPLWTGIEDRVQVAGGGWFSLSFLKRSVSTYRQLYAKYAALNKNYDVMVLGYPGQLDVFLARLLTWLHHKPLVLDLFMSIYLIAQERGLEVKSKLSVSLLCCLESLACRLPNLLICDTEAYVAWHHRTYGLKKDKFRLVPTGADDRLFKPIVVDELDDGKFKVLYYGTFIPNHGVDTIIEAANLLKGDPEIVFELVGTGPMKAKAIELARDYDLENVTFIDWIDKEALPEKISRAHVILGVFGTTPQSVMTIQNKIYEGLAMGKPVLTGDSPAVQQVLSHEGYAYLVERANPQALANGILALCKRPALRESLGSRGRRLFEERYSSNKLGLCFKKHLMELL